MKPILAVLLLSSFALAQPSQEIIRKQLEYTRAHYTKYDYRIPMRDGVKLFTSVYAPKDKSQRYPILMQRTPYSVASVRRRQLPDRAGPVGAVHQGGLHLRLPGRARTLSLRGAIHRRAVHKTQLAGANDTDESTDTYDTIDWLVKNVPNNNGKVGIWGISYPGFYAAFSLIHSHPALKAVSPQAPMGDVGNGDDAYHNGAFFLAANFGFYSSFKPRKANRRARKRQPSRSTSAPRTRTTFYLRMGPLRNANERYLKNENVYLDGHA